MSNQRVQSLNILLAMDGSDHSWAAARLLQQLPCFPDCKLTVLTVMTPRFTSRHFPLAQILDKTRELLQEGGPYVETKMTLYTTPAEGIIEFASQTRPDLIVMGARGLRSTLGILLGGTAQQVIEYVCCPVLVVRAPYKPLSKILVALDGSASGEQALEFISSFHLPPGCAVQVMHVMPPVYGPAEAAPSWATDLDLLPPAYVKDLESEFVRQAQEDEQRASSIVEQAMLCLKEAQIPTLEPVIARGDAATEIIDFAKQEAVDLLVAGSRGLSELRSILLGSVSRKLVHYAPCSVMIVRKE